MSLAKPKSDAPTVKRRGKRGKSKRKQGRPATKTSAREVARRQRAADIMALRVQGWSLEAIGEAQTPRVSGVRIHQIITETLAKTTFAGTDEIRRIELMRLDELQVKVYENAVKGDLLALDRVLAIMTQRRSLTGIASAEKVQVEEVGEVADAKSTLLAKLAKMNERLQLAHGPVIEGDAVDVTPDEPKTVN